MTAPTLFPTIECGHQSLRARDWILVCVRPVDHAGAHRWEWRDAGPHREQITIDLESDAL
jgi:hypothetical protein